MSDPTIVAQLILHEPHKADVIIPIHLGSKFDEQFVQCEEWPDVVVRVGTVEKIDSYQYDHDEQTNPPQAHYNKCSIAPIQS